MTENKRENRTTKDLHDAQDFVANLKAYKEAFQKICPLLQSIAYPRWGTSDGRMTLEDVANEIQEKFTIEYLRDLSP